MRDSTELRQRQAATPNYAPLSLTWRHTIEAVGIAAIGSGATAFAWQMTQAATAGFIASALLVASGAATIAAMPRAAKAGFLLARNGTLENSLGQVGRVVLDSLHHIGAIGDAEHGQAHIDIGRDATGARDISFAGLSIQSQKLALTAVAELLGPVRNPRYLLIRQGLRLSRSRADFHAVPTIIGANKAGAEFFATQWHRRIGPSKLVFTRNAEGRRTLLKARARSLAAGMQRRVERHSAWV